MNEQDSPPEQPVEIPPAETPLPSYRINIFPVRAKTPRPGMPSNFSQEMYDKWIADEEHIRFEEQCDAGKIWYWHAEIAEGLKGSLCNVDLHSTPFNSEHNTGYVQLREFTKDVMRSLNARAKDTMGDDESRIIRP